MSLTPEQKNDLDEYIKEKLLNFTFQQHNILLYQYYYDKLADEGWTGTALILEAMDLASKHYRGESD
jgi:hypothetical protein